MSRSGLRAIAAAIVVCLLAGCGNSNPRASLALVDGKGEALGQLVALDGGLATILSRNGGLFEITLATGAIGTCPASEFTSTGCTGTALAVVNADEQLLPLAWRCLNHNGGLAGPSSPAASDFTAISYLARNFDGSVTCRNREVPRQVSAQPFEPASQNTSFLDTLTLPLAIVAR